MIHFTKATTDADLNGILQLQKENLQAALTEEEIKSQGFVTVVHSFETLKSLNDTEPHLIAKDGHTVIAYLLCMTEKAKDDVPVLKPMFETFGSVSFAGKRIADFNYLVVGQVCVAKAYRGTGVLDACYEYYKNSFKTKYDFAITEIDAANLRSLNAHKRIGFHIAHRFKGADGVDWVVVLWDWNHLSPE